MKRITTETLITGPRPSLHYCCLWAFFSLFKSPTLIAARLGVCTKSVSNAKKRAMQEGCQHCPNCRKDQLSKVSIQFPSFPSHQ